ncbi:hypothetical protein TSMEX_004132 [Taenia solium]|eukprot:TsM_000211900 transcript=TsM_000211900 gene=TsM_000211900
MADHPVALAKANLHGVENLRNLQLKNKRLHCLPHAASRFWGLETLNLPGDPWVVLI